MSKMGDIDWGPMYEMNRQKEQFIKFKVTQKFGVDVRKPRWMPSFVWKWMWRQVTYTETPPKFERRADHECCGMDKLCCPNPLAHWSEDELVSGRKS